MKQGALSVELTRKTAPWAFERGEPYRTIASLELMGTLVGLTVLASTEGQAQGNKGSGEGDQGEEAQDASDARGLEG